MKRQAPGWMSPLRQRDRRVSVASAGVPPLSRCVRTRMAHAFGDARFMSAREKDLALKAWVRFLKHGLRFADFSDRLYRHLTLHASFIAHYDRAGFFAT